jgi:hypothetical protein
MAQANLELLGNAIRSFREQAQPKKISQFQLAVLMGWEGTAPIVEIEKGRRHPRPETLNALGRALQLSPADIAYLHGLAGYREVTTMLPTDQIIRVLEAVAPEIAQHFYPVYIMDYQFRFWMMNTAVAAFDGGSLDHSINSMRQGIDGLTMSFTSRPRSNRDFAYEAVMEADTIFRFKAYNLYRRHEPFYLAYPQSMQAKLTPEDYARFERRWNEVDVRIQDMYPINPQLTHRRESMILTFDIHIVEIPHLDRQLFAAYYTPARDESGNRERCEAHFAEYSPTDRGCIRAWDFPENGHPLTAGRGASHQE